MQEQEHVVPQEEARAAAPEAADAHKDKGESASLNRVLDVDLELRVELGRVNLPIREILELSSGAVVDLKKAVGEPVDILVNDKPLAKGEVVVVDELLGVRITELLDTKAQGEHLG